MPVACAAAERLAPLTHILAPHPLAIWLAPRLPHWLGCRRRLGGGGGGAGAGAGRNLGPGPAAAGGRAVSGNSAQRWQPCQQQHQRHGGGQRPRRRAQLRIGHRCRRGHGRQRGPAGAGVPALRAGSGCGARLHARARARAPARERPSLPAGLCGGRPGPARAGGLQAHARGAARHRQCGSAGDGWLRALPGAGAGPGGGTAAGGGAGGGGKAHAAAGAPAPLRGAR